MSFNETHPQIEKIQGNKNNLSPHNRDEYEKFCETVAEEGDRYGKFWAPERRKGYIEQGISFVVDIHEKQVDTIVVLDTSARPLGLFFKAIWKRLYPNEKAPQIKFIIGHRLPIMDINHPESRYYDSFVSERNAFQSSVSKLRNTFKSQTDESAGSHAFDDKTVLILDDYGTSGMSLNNAKERLSLAFPGVKQFLLGVTAWDTNAYQRPNSVDIKPPDLSKADPNFYGDIDNRKYEIGWVLYGQTKHVIKNNEPTDATERFRLMLYPESGNVVSVRNKDVPAGVHTIGSRLYNVGKFETTDQVSIDKADLAIKYCEENGDTEGLKRAKKIKQAYLDLQV